jgi:signal transduction histidine kinase
MAAENVPSSASLLHENARLRRELDAVREELSRARAREAEALDQQGATDRVLQLLDGSRADTQPVFDAILASAVRLCDGIIGSLFRFDGELISLAAQVDTLDEPGSAGWRSYFPMPPDRRTVFGKAILSQATVHVADLGEDRRFPEVQRALGYRSALVVPLLRAGTVIGAIMVLRDEVLPFNDRQIGLLETFADQAVIAIENTRLFGELIDRSCQLAEASRHKSEFLANMSHELRTPLNAIIGFSEVLAEQLFGELNSKQLEYVNDVLTSGQHLLSLINDILDLSKVEAGRMELVASTFSLREALGNGLTMLKERASRHGIELALEVEDGLDLVEADERKVKQMVFNLLSNAVKFTPDGGRVELSARRADGAVEVSVRDTGIGIAPGDLPRVFDEFRQVGRDEARAEGTGLGLALTKRLVELHSGRIRAESELGVGSTFTFTLPTPPATPRDELPA